MQEKSRLKELCPRLSRESAKAYKAFCDFALAELSLRELTDKYIASEDVPTKKYNTLLTWSAKFDWKERKDTWRSYCLKLQEEEFLNLNDELRKRLAENAFKLIDRAEAILKHPLVEQKVEREIVVEGQRIPTEIVVRPCKWGASTAALYLQVSSSLMKEIVGDESWAIEILTRLGYKVSIDDI